MELLDNLLMPLQALLRQVGELAPKLLFAAGIVLGGYLLAKAVRFAAVKTLRAINFHILAERSGLDAFLQQGGSRIDTTAVLGVLAYWLTILAALVLASETLGLMEVTVLLGRMSLFVPRLMLAVVILAGGAYFAGVIDSAVAGYGRSVGFDEAAVIGRAARYAVLLFVVLIALEQLDIGADLIRYSFLIILGGLVLALALAFGLGGRAWAASLLERWQRSREPQRGGSTERRYAAAKQEEEAP